MRSEHSPARPPVVTPRPPIGTGTTFAIANINPGTISTHTVQSFMAALHIFHYRDAPPDQLLPDDPYMAMLSFTHSGPYLDDGRNKAVQRTLADTDAEVILFVDSDVEFTPDDIRKLFRHDFTQNPVIAGYYRNLFADGWSPVVYWKQTPDPDNLKRGWLNEPSPDGGYYSELAPIGDDGWDMLIPIPDTDGLLACHVVGAGFLAIHRSLLDEMFAKYGRPCPWFAEAIDTTRLIHMGEDTTFCMRVYELGYNVAVDPTIGLAHTKSIHISSNPKVEV